MHTTSPVLATSLRVFGPASGGCTSTSPMLGTQWSPGLSSSWAFSYPSPPTLSSPMLPTYHAYDVVV
ncbi:hypothetical protein GW17_00002991 [Ensete ventricosum]|nr:hypothetical protein GW17_00002991 [Ensete ventricosum]